MGVAAVIVAKQMHQRAQQQDQVWQGLRKMSVVLSRHVENADDGEHDQHDTEPVPPEGWFSGTRVMGVVHDNSLDSTV